ncbi:MAG: serine/threonine-protein kinase [Pseudomonadota bacterium]
MHRALPPSNMGVVYFCFDTAAGIPVVAKSIPPAKLSDSAIRSRFLQECDLWIKLDHHSTVATALYVESVDSIPYVFIEWIVGPVNSFDSSAAELLRRRGALPVDLALSLAVDICDGMIFLADKFATQGLVFAHGDLKPSNVLVDVRWTGKVTDFGLSAAMPFAEGASIVSSDIQGSPSAQQFAVGPGTVAYMAPEQYLVGQTPSVSCDIYSFGCTLWEFLTGRRLFEHIDKQDLWNAHLKQEPPFAALDSLSLPAGLADLLKTCVEKSPSNRPRSFSEVLAALSDICVPLSKRTAPKPKANENTDGIRNDLIKAITEASSLDAMGQSVEALDIYNRVRQELQACQSQPSSMTFMLGWNRAIALEHVGNYQEALKEWDTLLTLVSQKDLSKGQGIGSVDPTRPNVLTAKAKTLYAMGRVAEAISVCKSALELTPDLVEAMSTLASFHLKAGHSQESQYWARRALEANPHDASALATLGSAIASTGAHGEGLSYVERALAIAPSHEHALYSKGTCLLHLGRYNEAAKVLRQAVEFHSHYSEAWNHLGLAKRALGEADCRDCFAMALKTNPSNKAARANLAETDALMFLNALLQLSQCGGGAFQFSSDTLTVEFLDALSQRIAHFEQMAGRRIDALTEAVRSLDKIRYLIGVEVIECSISTAAGEFSIHFRYALAREGGK